MTYKINGTEILQPTTGRWLEREAIGINGFGNSIYPGVRSFELRWAVQSPSEYSVVYGFFNSLGNTGTVIIDLPQFGASTYTFKSYTGCILEEPVSDRYFAENQSEVVLIVRNIRT